MGFGALERERGERLAEVDDAVVELAVAAGAFTAGAVVEDGRLVGCDGAEIYQQSAMGCGWGKVWEPYREYILSRSLCSTPGCCCRGARISYPIAHPININFILYIKATDSQA